MEVYTGGVPGSDISPEAELLLCCARVDLNSNRVERIRSILGYGIDWAYLLRVAVRHGMRPLLYWHLNATYPEAVPRTVLKQFQDHFHLNLQRNLLRTAKLFGLLNMFKAHGIVAIPYKGPALASSVYGDLAFREFSDLDLLLDMQDVPMARKLLISQGYRPQLNLNSVQQTAFLQSQCEYLFERAEDRLFLELHWQITPHHFSFPLDLKDLWERLVPVSVAGREVLTLSPEDLLLVLSVHGTKQLWERLGWICDVAELIRLHQGMKWTWVMERADHLGGRRMLFLSLFLARNLLGTTLPDEVVERVEADRVVKRLARRIGQRLFQDIRDSPGPLAYHLFYLRAREHLRDRIRHCAGLVLTPGPADWVLLPLADPFSALYRPVRALRLASTYGLGLVRRVFSGSNARNQRVD